MRKHSIISAKYLMPLHGKGVPTRMQSLMVSVAVFMHLLRLLQAVLGSGPGAVLVTGGTGALGTAVAGWLPARGARRLILASRTGSATPAVRRLVAGPAFGAMVTITRADVGACTEAQLAAAMPVQVSMCTSGVCHAPLQSLLARYIHRPDNSRDVQHM